MATTDDLLKEIRGLKEEDIPELRSDIRAMIQAYEGVPRQVEVLKQQVAEVREIAHGNKDTIDSWSGLAKKAALTVFGSVMALIFGLIGWFIKINH